MIYLFYPIFVVKSIFFEVYLYLNCNFIATFYLFIGIYFCFFVWERSRKSKNIDDLDPYIEEFDKESIRLDIEECTREHMCKPTYSLSNFANLFYYKLFILLFILLFYVNFFLYNISFYNTVWYSRCYNFLNVNLDLSFSLDYLSLYFVILTSFIFFIIYLTIFSVKFSSDHYDLNIKFILFLFFFIEFCLIATFSVSNIFFFFFFFECSLMPLYILVIMLGKGVKKKHYASLSLVFFTLTGSIFLLFGIIYITIITGFCDFKSLNMELIDFNSQLFLFVLFFLGFSVKVPIFPFYSWLPEAHVEASTSISILLAAVFLKVATYGLLKIVIFNFYMVIAYYYSIIFYFSLISIILASLLTLIQTDLKKIIALSSIVHMNYMVIALFSLDPKAIIGSVIYMFSHAFVSSGLFFLVGIIYDNSGTRDLLNFSFQSKYTFNFFFFFMIFNLANLSFPLLVSFVSELVLLNNLMYSNVFVLVILLTSIFFSTIYTFWMLHNFFFGKNNKKNFFFITFFDILFLSFLLCLIFALGLFPFLIMFNLEQEIYIILLNKLNIY